PSPYDYYRQMVEGVSKPPQQSLEVTKQPEQLDFAKLNNFLAEVSFSSQLKDFSNNLIAQPPKEMRDLYQSIANYILKDLQEYLDRPNGLLSHRQLASRLNLMQRLVFELTQNIIASFKSNSKPTFVIRKNLELLNKFLFQAELEAQINMYKQL